jgi:hypothetical protein
VKRDTLLILQSDAPAAEFRTLLSVVDAEVELADMQDSAPTAIVRESLTSLSATSGPIPEDRAAEAGDVDETAVAAGGDREEAAAPPTRRSRVPIQREGCGRGLRGGGYCDWHAERVTGGCCRWQGLFCDGRSGGADVVEKGVGKAFANRLCMERRAR